MVLVYQGGYLKSIVVQEKPAIKLLVFLVDNLLSIRLQYQFPNCLSIPSKRYQ